MSRSSLSAFLLLILILVSQVGHAQTVNVTDGTNSLTWTVDQTGANASQTLAGASPSVDNDILFEEGWFLNVGGQVVRLADTNPANITVTGNNTSTVNISYSSVQVASSLFDVDLTYQVSSTPTGLIDIALEAELNFLQGNAATVGSVINYFDYDIDGSTSQTAVFAGSPDPTISQINPATGSGYSRLGIGADAFDIESFSLLRTSLESANLLDSSPNLGVIDVTGALQWDFNLDPGDSFALSGGGSGVISEGVVVPEPSVLGTMVLLIGAMSLRRSRRG